MTRPRQPHQSREPIRCLVIQLARLGDTVQSLMGLRAAKQLYPELEIHFVTRERFAAAARRVTWIKEVITLPTDTLIKPQALAELARWVRPLVGQRWDFVVNWTYSEASSYLTELLPAHVKLGYRRRNDGAFAADDGWSQYVQAIVQGQLGQSIHLTDILTTQLLTALQIQAGEPTEAENEPVTSKTFFNLSASAEIPGALDDHSRKWLAVQLGAAEESKTWPADHWSDLITYILDRHPNAGVILLGGPEDTDKAQQILDEVDAPPERLISVAGKTDFDQWAGIIGKSQWLLSCDTAAIHLASVMGTRVLNISVGPVRWAETGPYGNGHYVVCAASPCPACDTGNRNTGHTCRNEVTPEAVYATWVYASSEWAHNRKIGIEGHFSQLGWNSELGSVRVYRSHIRTPDEGGGVVYESLISRSLRIEDWTSLVMGSVARAWYCGWTPPVGQDITRELLSPSLLKQLRMIEESASVLAEVSNEGRKAATELAKHGASLVSNRVMNVQDRVEFQRLGQKLLEIDKLIDRVAQNCVAMLPFTRIAKVLMHNLAGDQLSELGTASAKAYQQLHEGVSVMLDWARHTLELARPEAVMGATVIPLNGRRPRDPEITQ